MSLTHLQKTLKDNLDVGKFCIVQNLDNSKYNIITPICNSLKEYRSSGWCDSVEDCIKNLGDSYSDGITNPKLRFVGTYNPSYKRLEEGQQVRYRNTAYTVTRYSRECYLYTIFPSNGSLSPFSSHSYNIPIEGLELIVDEPEPKEITLAEVAALLGVKSVKIVK